MDLSVSIGEQDKKRKAKEQRRRQAKEERKTKIKEQTHQKQLNPERKIKKQFEKKALEVNKEQLTMELLQEMNIAEKLTFIKTTQNEIIGSPEEKYRRLLDLTLCCSDPKDIDVVIRAIKALCEIFCDILPSYRIREQKTNVAEDGEKQQKKVSKEVQQMREYEQVMLSQYKNYLKILEVFSNTKPEKIIKKKGIQDDMDKKKKALDVYRKLRELSFLSFCKLLKRHPHFNYRINILQSIMPKLSTTDLLIRNECTQTLFELLQSEDNTLLDFKLEILKELSKIIKSKQHHKMDPNLLDCLVTHQIIVDEQKAKTIDESSRKMEELKLQMEKLRKKGKFSDYRDMKQNLIQELKESDAIGVDLGKSSKFNNAIIKEILSIYFDILKNKSESHLLKGVFLGLPQFTQYINIEIVWDLINVLREYIKVEFEELNEEEKQPQPGQVQVRRKKGNIQNVLSGLLCAFQIIDVGAGTAFNVEEKDFIDALYSVIQRLIEHPYDYKVSDFLAFAKCMTIVFIQRRQYSNDLVNAFAKRLALLSIHLSGPEQAGVLFLIKQILTKYPSSKSSLIETDEEGLTNAFGGQQVIYKPDINDPQLSNATQSSIVLEMIHTLHQNKNKTSEAAYQLSKSILYNEGVPHQFLGLNVLQVIKNLTQQQKF